MTGAPVGALQSTWQASIGPVGQAAGVGIDLVEVEPLRQLVEHGGSAFIEAAWTKREQRDANCLAEGLAGKWAAKEAVMKALQRGIGDMDPRDVEIVTNASGAPGVELHRKARVIAKSRRIAGWHVSVTHDGGWAVAIAVALSHRPKLADTVTTTLEGRNFG